MRLSDLYAGKYEVVEGLPIISRRQFGWIAPDLSKTYISSTDKMKYSHEDLAKAIAIEADDSYEALKDCYSRLVDQGWIRISSYYLEQRDTINLNTLKNGDGLLKAAHFYIRNGYVVRATIKIKKDDGWDKSSFVTATLNNAVDINKLRARLS